MLGNAQQKMLEQYLQSTDLEEIIAEVSDDLLREVGKQIPIEKVDNREPSYSELESRHESVRDGLMAARHHLNRGNNREAQEVVENLLEELDG